MLISYRDSKRYPSDAPSLQAWVAIAEAMARQVVCRSRGFDVLQFARVLELCRRLTCRRGPESLRRMIHACASAGVAVVVVPGFAGCHASSASKWAGGGAGRRVALSTPTTSPVNCSSHPSTSPGWRRLPGSPLRARCRMPLRH